MDHESNHQFLSALKLFLSLEMTKKQCVLFFSVSGAVSWK